MKKISENKPAYCTKNIVPNQIFILFSTGFFISIDCFFLFGNSSFSLIALLIIQLMFFIALNYFFGKLKYLKIEDDIVFIKSLWSRKKFNLIDLKDIDTIDFFIPLPTNSFMKFIFSNDKKVITVLPNRLKLFLSGESLSDHIKNLKKKLIEK